jgi:hypothetical protein
MVIFAECFSEKIIYGCNELLNGGSAREIQVGVEKDTKRMNELFELGCPLYVCAFVATLLHQMWSNRLITIKGNAEDSGASSSSSSSLSSSAVPAASATLARIIEQTITVEERAKLHAGLVKILGRKLPSFWNLQKRPRDRLSFRDFLKSVNSRGSHEAKKLANLERACRWSQPAPTQGVGTGGVTTSLHRS